MLDNAGHIGHVGVSQLSHAGKWKTMCPLLYNRRLSLPPGESMGEAHISISALFGVAAGFLCSQSLEFERIIGFDAKFQQLVQKQEFLS